MPSKPLPLKLKLRVVTWARDQMVDPCKDLQDSTTNNKDKVVTKTATTIKDRETTEIIAKVVTTKTTAEVTATSKTVDLATVNISNNRTQVPANRTHKLSPSNLIKLLTRTRCSSNSRCNFLK